jgi:hypothetical protein
MQENEIEFVLRLLSGYWPSPALSQDEIDVWMRQLAQCEDVQLATQIIDGLARTGRDFRPNAGQFAAEYTARRPRFPRVGSEAVAALEVTTEDKTPEEWMADAREKLRVSDGPLVKDLARTINDGK